MCTNCQDTIRGFIKIKHDPQNCPLLQARYCSICAIHGHTTLSCPDEATLQYRKPQYVEQLLPPSYLDKYAITTRTPMPGFTEESNLRGTLDVLDTDKHMRALLMNHNIVPSHKIKDNRVAIITLAARLHRKIVFVKADGTRSSPEDEANEAQGAQAIKDTKPKAKKKLVAT